VAILDSETRQLVLGALLGGAAVLVAPRVVRVATPALRPVAKALVAQGMLLSARGVEAFYRMGEGIEDLVAEARADVDRELRGATDATTRGHDGGRERPSRKRPRGEA
jgi:hypothetical protein